MRAFVAFAALLLLAFPALADDPQPGTPPPAPPASSGDKTEANKKGKDKGDEGRVEVAGVSGADSVAAKVIETTAEVDAFEYRLPIVESDRRPVAEVAIAVEPFVDEKGRQYPYGWGVDGKLAVQDLAVVAKPLAASGRKTLLINAQLPELGTYTTTITPYWGEGAHQKITLKVVRTRPPLNLAVADAAPFAQDATTDFVTFSLALRETAGRKLLIDRPALLSLSETVGTDAKAMSISREARLTVRADGRDVTSKDGINLQPGKARDVTFHLAGFPGPGKYEAKLQFTADGTLPLEKSVTLYVRRHWFVAALLIGLGVAISWLTRWWTGKEQPRLQLLEQASRLAPDLESLDGLDDVEQSLVEEVRGLLARLLSGISQGRAGADATAIDVMARRVAAVRNFVAVRRTVRGAADPVRAEFLKKLDIVRDDLANPETDLAKLKEHDATLRALPAQLATAVQKQAITEELAEVKKEQTDPAKAKQLVADIDGLLEKNEFAAAAKRLQEERDDIAAAKKAAGVGGTMGAPGALFSAIAANRPGAGFATPRLDEALTFTGQALARGTLAEIGINLAILVIAVLLGMKALYVEDLSWGRTESLLVAFLWGLGLHQFTYGGIGGLVDKVTKPGATT